jgi:alpha-beta hydrolase superfamily lysophospholipase
MRVEAWSSPNAQGERLSGRLDLPDGAPRAWALFAHCFTCGKDILAARRIAAGLATRGIATLRFDFTGLGSSEGDFANTGFSSNIADILAAVAQLRAEGRVPALLIGHSLGGAAVLAATAGIPEVRAVAVIGAPFSVAHLLDTLEPQLAAVARDGEAQVTIAGRSFTLRRDFVEDLQRQDQGVRIAHLGKALLILHAPQDAIVGIDNARAIFDAARHPKSFVALDGADHLLTRPLDAEFVADILATWLPRYLDPFAVAAEPAVPGNAVAVTETGGGRFQQQVEAGGHYLVADEPASAGGLALAPTPTICC